MKTLFTGMLFCISLQLIHAQTFDANQITISADDGPVFVVQEGSALKKYNARAHSSSITQKGNKHYIIEFKEQPHFIERKSKKGVSNEKHIARFAQLLQDINKLHRKHKSKTVPKIRKQFHKVFFGAEAELTPELASAIRELEYVKSLSEVQMVEAVLDQSVSIIKADQVWSTYGNKGEGVTIGIIDTGIDYNHPALGNGIGSTYKIKGGYDFVNNDNDPMDDHGHGTHCAGIVAGDGSNVQGIAPHANLVALKVLNAQGAGTSSDIIAAIEWAADPDQNGDESDKLDILSLSLGGPGDPNDAMSGAVDNAVSLGIVVCVAAGNSYDNFKISSPGTARNGITVGASDNAGNIAGFSSKGPNTNLFSIKPEVVAPGVEINSTVLNGGFASWSGTSMATPTVAGVAALLKSMHGDWTNDQIKSAIMITASDLGKEAMSQGAGQVDAFKAIKTTTFITPAHLSFGMMAGTGTQIKNDTLIVFNADSVTKHYNTTEAGLPGGLTLTASPSSFSIAPGNTQQLVITASIDHSVLPIPDRPSGTYSGRFILTSATDTLSVPWAVVKSGRILLTFDSPYPSVWISGAKGVNSNITFTNNGYAGEAFMSPQEVDVLTISDGTTMIIRENVMLTGADAIHISTSEAIHTVLLNAVDHNGVELNNASQFYRIELPSRSASRSSVIGLFISENEFNMSSFSSRFQIFMGHRRNNITTDHTIYSIQHPTLEGLQNDITLSNSAADYISQDIEIISPVDTAFKMGVGTCFTDDQRYFFGLYYFTGNFTGSWKGKLYQSKTNPNADQGSVGLQAVPLEYPLGSLRPLVTLPPLMASGNGISASKNSPVRPNVYISPSGNSMEFGTGIFYPNTPSTRITDISFYGKFNESLDFERGNATYRLLNETGIIIHQGSLSLLDEGKLLPGKNHLEVELTPSGIQPIPGKGTYKAKFDLTNGDKTYLFLNSFQILNSQFMPADTLELGDYASIRFSILPGFKEKHLYVKSHHAETWKELKLVKIAEETSGYSAFGYLFEATIATFDTLGPMDIKISAVTTKGNEMEWILERAFVFEDQSQPAISVHQGPTAIAHKTNYNFGAVVIGQSSPVTTFTIQNTGADPLALNGTPLIKMSSGNLTMFHIDVSATAAVLAPGESTAFNAVFTPTQPGIMKDTLWIRNNASTDNPYYIILNGTSAGPEMEIKTGQTIIPSAGNFTYAPVLVGSTYMYTFTILNTGSVDLNFTGTPKIQISGPDASSYIITQQNLPAKISAGASSSFIIQFKPLSPGVKNATISIANNDSDENPYTFALKGTAISGDINIKHSGADILPATTVVDMGSFLPGHSSETFSFTVENLGDGPLGFYNTVKVYATGNNAADFVVTSSAMPSQIMPGSTTYFTIKFAPKAGEGGTRSAEIIVNSNDYDEAQFKFKVRGTVPSPEVAVAYYTSNLAQGSTRTFTATHVGFTGTKFRYTLENKGATNLQLNNPERMRLSGPDSLDYILDYAAVPENLAPGTSAYFYISFKPTSHGTRKAKLIISNNDLDESPFTLNLTGEGLFPDIDIQHAGVSLPSGTGSYDFGTIVSGTSSQPVSLQVANVGYTPLSFYSSPIITKNSGNINEFTISQSAVPGTLQPGGVASFTVTFTPVSTGQKSVVLRVNSSDVDEYTYTITIKGNASSGVSGRTSAEGNREQSLETSETLVDVSVFPNPSKNSFTIYLPEEQHETHAHVKVSNPLGVIVSDENLLRNSYHTKGDDWSPGIYFIEVAGKVRRVIKVVKE